MVVLVNSPIYKDNNTEDTNEYLPPLGLGYIASNLKENGIEVMVLDAVQKGMNLDEICCELHKIKPEVIGINIFSINIDIVRSMVESYQNDCRFIVGGQCAKHIYKDIIAWNTKNEIVVVIGEGDYITSDITLNAVNETPMLCIENRKVYKVDTSSKYYPKDLENNHLNRNLLNETDIINHFGLKEKAIITSRGCFYNCAFCGAAKSLNTESNIRMLTPQAILEQINEIFSMDPSIECIRILDDLFLRNKIKINEAIKIFNEICLKWRAMAHIKSFVNTDDDSLVNLKQSGCLELFIGIESGSDKIRKLLKKNGSAEEVKKIIYRLLKAGINVKGYFIYGFPTETKEDMEESYLLASSLKESSKFLKGDFRTSIFQYKPYHGTELYNKFVDGVYDDLIFQENEILTGMTQKSQFNGYYKNFSECADDILYNYIYKTNNL
ncbi:radical SAM protein [Mobilitalea sibirica]|uniref:Radical SAM protein n=1 Tax=Mobilitalea sibirica TaxID=1462919 RepID=A0A8J7KT70_9FIRM|nr:radical SAM protein [Mobilitalea sibirica]MBH1941061.1 radical SAM protein [Mobilitalea sibirica]